MVKEAVPYIPLHKRLVARFRGKVAGVEAYFLPGDATVVNSIPEIKTDEHELGTRLHAIGVNQGDREKFEVGFKPLPDDAEDLITTDTHLLRRWWRRGQHNHEMTFGINVKKLAEDPTSALEAINTEVDNRIKRAGHNMMHTHRLRNTVGVGALVSVGTTMSNLYKNSPWQLPNITMVDIPLPFTVHIPFDVPFNLIPATFSDIRVTTAVLAGYGVGFVANRIVHGIGHAIHEHRTDTRFARYDRVVAERRPVVSLAEPVVG